MTWVKLCGMRTSSDVAGAVAAGADAVGFVVAPESARRVTPEQAAAAGEGCGLERYLVTVDLDPDALLDAAAVAGVTGVQPHGAWSAPAAAAALRSGLRVLFPIRVAGAIDVAGVPQGAIPILDTALEGRHGGAGKSFPWSLAAGLDRPFVLAGGLTPGNVAEAIRLARPWGVDVSSGVERAPGEKDPDLMRRFVEAAK